VRRVNTGSWRVPARLLGQAPRPPLPATDRPQAASSNFLSDIVSGTESTGFIEDLVRLQAEATADDLLLGLGGAAEDRRDFASDGRCSARSTINGIFSISASNIDKAYPAY